MHELFIDPLDARPRQEGEEGTLVSSVEVLPPPGMDWEPFTIRLYEDDGFSVHRLDGTTIYPRDVEYDAEGGPVYHFKREQE